MVEVRRNKVDDGSSSEWIETLFPMIHRVPLPTPFAVGDINSYFIEGSKPTLIDVGVKSSKSLSVLEEHLEAIGYKLSDIKRIILTHHHLDHTGAAALIAKQNNAEVLMSSSCKDKLEIGDKHHEIYWEFLLRCGFPKELGEQIQSGSSMMKKFSEDWDSFDGVKLIEDGDEIEFDDFALKCLSTPGHCPDHLCFYSQERHVAFSGDHLLPKITPNPLLYFDADTKVRRKSLIEYLDSLDRFEALREMKAVFPGHGKPIENVYDLIKDNRRKIEIRKKAFIELLQKNGESLVFDIAAAHFGKLHLMEYYLAVSETIAYLDLLVQEGSLELIEAENSVTARLA